MGYDMDPGANDATGTARRRRTTVAAAAAVAVIAVGVAVVTRIGGADQATPPVSPTTEVPGPAPLDPAAMNAGTAGWVSGWHGPGKADESQWASIAPLEHCQGTVPDRVASIDPTRSGFDGMEGEQAVATIKYADFGTAANDAAMWDAAFTRAFAKCTGVSGSTMSYDGGRGSVTSFALPARGTQPSGRAWVARLDNRIAIVLLVAQGTPSDQAVSDVGSAAIAAGRLVLSRQVGPVELRVNLDLLQQRLRLPGCHASRAATRVRRRQGRRVDRFGVPGTRRWGSWPGHQPPPEYTHMPL